MTIIQEYIGIIGEANLNSRNRLTVAISLVDNVLNELKTCPASVE